MVNAGLGGAAQNAADGVGDGFEKFLATRAVPLEPFNDADPLQQDRFLLLKIVHLHL